MYLTNFEVELYRDKTLSQVWTFAINRRMLTCVTALVLSMAIWKFSFRETVLSAVLMLIVGSFWAYKDVQRYKRWLAYKQRLTRRKEDDHDRT